MLPETSQSAAPVLQALSEAAPPPAPSSKLIERGSRDFRRAVIALFASGFSTFSLLYYVQPLLPVFSQDFGVSPAISSLTLSLTTGLLALAMLVASVISESLGRRNLMIASLLSSAALGTGTTFFPDWTTLLIARTLMGLTLSGLPAVAMAYVGEEIHPRSSGLAMGLYIGGSAIGGMSGRLLAGLIADAYGWRMATLLIGLIGFIGTFLFWKTLPRSRNFHKRPLKVAAAVASFRDHLGNAVLRRIFLQGFLVMGSFVAVYNFIGFHLLAPPFSLSQAAVGMVSVVYLAGIFSSAWMGDLAARLGHRHVLWVAVSIELLGALMTLSSTLWLSLLGITVMTFGFFGAHSVCSSWVPRAASNGRAQASALYLFAYYVGASVIGMAAGFIMVYSWTAMVVSIALLLAWALFNASWLARKHAS